MKNLDFLKGWKTISGLIILLAPLISEKYGISITTEGLNQAATMVANLNGQIQILVGTGLTLYGLIMKIVRK